MLMKHGSVAMQALSAHKMDSTCASGGREAMAGERAGLGQRAAAIVAGDRRLNRVARLVAWLEGLAACQMDEEQEEADRWPLSNPLHLFDPIGAWSLRFQHSAWEAWAGTRNMFEQNFVPKGSCWPLIAKVEDEMQCGFGPFSVHIHHLHLGRTAQSTSEF